MGLQSNPGSRKYPVISFKNKKGFAPSIWLMSASTNRSIIGIQNCADIYLMHTIYSTSINIWREIFTSN
ncbi:hypothetical protein HZS_6821 [Henneguya salminicola]|nr:hypothetical protein HZS_6821 [Henneguya salminicola]